MIKLALKSILPAGIKSKIVTQYETLFSYGFRYKCPFCSSHLRTFRPYGLKLALFTEKQVIGGGYRNNARCPICASFDRERLLYLYLKEKTDLFSAKKKLLHVAPEKRMRKILESIATVDYLTADFSASDVMVKMDICDIQYPDNSFDAIICNHVLEHVADDKKAMSELYRTLKSGGWAILQVPISLTQLETHEDATIISEKERETAFGQSDHVRLYGQDYKSKLEQSGFNVSVFNWMQEGDSFGGPSNYFGLLENEMLYVATK